MNVFAKLSKVKQLLRKINIPEEEIIPLVRGAAKWHYKKRSNITLQEAKVYETLISNSYNPDTIYKWLLLAKSPLELREQLQAKLISQKQAFAQKKELNHLGATSHQKLLYHIIDSVNRYVIR